MSFAVEHEKWAYFCFVSATPEIRKHNQQSLNPRRRVCVAAAAAAGPTAHHDERFYKNLVCHGILCLKLSRPLRFPLKATVFTLLPCRMNSKVLTP
jgi:hypothetical protein